MSGKYTCCIDKERLSESIKVLDDLENYMSNNYLISNILEIEEIIRNINIDHNNCIEKYKEKINNLLDEIQRLKKSINKLSSSVNVTIKEFSEADQFKTKDIEDIFGKFDNSTDVTNLAVNNNLNVASNVQEFKESMATNIIGAVESSINTVPIGLGIGAAGITAAAGAVVVDSMSKSKNEAKYEYKPEEDEKYDMEEMNYENDEHKIVNYDDFETEKPEPEKIETQEEITATPYFANRDRVKNDKFYDDIN